MKLNLSELFYSLQGEGPATGHPAVFIRTAGCNLNCGVDGGTWKCDTWDIMKNTKLSIEPRELGEEIKKILPIIVGRPRMVFTGGEPTLQADALEEAVGSLRGTFLNSNIHSRCDIETNGTKYHQGLFGLIQGYTVVSPKLSNSMIPREKRLREDDLYNILENAKNPVVKFVVSNETDIEEIMTDFVPILKGLSRGNWKDIVYLMPGMETIAGGVEVKKFVWNRCASLGLKMSIRAHIEVWDKKAGV